jgi:uncharacterized protein YjbI with pentapeptide repeats
MLEEAMSILNGAYLKGANLTGADLRGADLSSVKELTRKQLEQAFADENTRLPFNLRYLR